MLNKYFICFEGEIKNKNVILLGGYEYLWYWNGK